MGREALDSVTAEFFPGAAPLAAEPLTTGHIHESWVVTLALPSTPPRRWLFQRINTHVFRDLDALIGNLERVSSHRRAWARREGKSDLERRAPLPLRTRAGSLVAWDREGHPWRAFPYLERTRSYEVPESAAQARAAARAFGSFVRALAHLPPPPPAVALPHFHDLGRRIAALESASVRDPCGRMAAVREDVGATRRLLARLDAENRRARPRRVHRRVVHNDCKLNNVLFDAATGEALCVVDLDTVMEGELAYDFGELVRTAACPAREDEPSLDRVRVDPELFASLALGFLEGVGDGLTDDEFATLPLAGARMALENAIRFLTDHLEGDRYFRVTRPGHNLVRHRAQRRLAECLLEALPMAEQALAEARSRVAAAAETPGPDSA